MEKKPELKSALLEELSPLSRKSKKITVINYEEIINLLNDNDHRLHQRLQHMEEKQEETLELIRTFFYHLERSGL